MDATFISGMTALPEYEHRALLLDDDDANRMLLSVALQMGQLPFEEAANGKAALDLWKPGKFSFAFLEWALKIKGGIDLVKTGFLSNAIHFAKIDGKAIIGTQGCPIEG